MCGNRLVFQYQLFFKIKIVKGHWQLLAYKHCAYNSHFYSRISGKRISIFIVCFAIFPKQNLRVINIAFNNFCSSRVRTRWECVSFKRSGSDENNATGLAEIETVVAFTASLFDIQVVTHHYAKNKLNCVTEALLKGVTKSFRCQNFNSLQIAIMHIDNRAVDSNWVDADFDCVTELSVAWAFIKPMSWHLAINVYGFLIKLYLQQ